MTAVGRLCFGRISERIVIVMSLTEDISTFIPPGMAFSLSHPPLNIHADADVLDQSFFPFLDAFRHYQPTHRQK